MCSRRRVSWWEAPRWYLAAVQDLRACLQAQSNHAWSRRSTFVGLQTLGCGGDVMTPTSYAYVSRNCSILSFSWSKSSLEVLTTAVRACTNLWLLECLRQIDLPPCTQWGCIGVGLGLLWVPMQVAKDAGGPTCKPTIKWAWYNLEVWQGG